MSSRDRIPDSRARNRRQVLALLVSVALAGPLVSACQPLYGTTPGGESLKETMAGVEIATIPGRVGQRVRNELIFSTTRGGYAGEPKYRLEIIVRESVTDLLVNREGDKRGQIFNLTAEFALVRKSDNEIVFKGKSIGRAAFDRFDPIFANVRAKIDAENRAADTVADGIRTRIASYLSSTA